MHTKKGHRRKKKKKSILYILVQILLIGIFLFSGYKVTLYGIDYYKNKHARDEMKALYYGESGQDLTIDPADSNDTSGEGNIGTGGNTGTQRQRMAALQRTNPEIIGWIAVPGTNIDYPVTQSTDNDKYLHYGANGKRNANGSIFMDYRNDPVSLSKNTILYGHNMNSKTMFNNLLKYRSEDFYKKAQVVYFSTAEKTIQGEIFAAYATKVNTFNYNQTDFIGDDAFSTFLSQIRSRSIYHTNIMVSSEDKILTLSTCTNARADERFVVQVKLNGEVE